MTKDQLDTLLTEAVADAIGEFPRIVHWQYALRGPGWYVEARRLKTRSIWEGPYPTRKEAKAARP